MITVTGFAQKKVAVLGLGRTGMSAARALVAGGADVLAWDDNAANREVAEMAGIACHDLEKRDWSDIAALILSPGIAHTHPEPHHVVELARAVDVPVMGDTELFARSINAIPAKDRPMVFGITGTNGKTTTTALLTHILRESGQDAHAGGNIGTPCLDLPEPHPGIIYVLELSSYQLELTQSLHCNGAILLNLSPDHLDRHGGFAGYEAAKRRVFANQAKDDLAILSMDDAHSQKICVHFLFMNEIKEQAKTIPVSALATLSHGISYAAGKIFDSITYDVPLCVDIGDAPALMGRHNGQNAAAAYVAARHAGLPADMIASAMQTFTGLEHRMEDIGTINGVRFINDSKATNAEAVRQALGAFDDIFWIAGGRAKAGGLDALDRAYDDVRQAFLIGEAQNAFARQLKGKVEATKCGTLQMAVREAFNTAMEADVSNPVVLLSPACASFDQFKDFKARGDAFRAAMSELKDKQKQQKSA